MSMFNDIELNIARIEQMCINNAQEVADYSKDFRPRCWCFTGPASERSWNYDTVKQTRGTWTAVAEKMIDVFAQSGHPAENLKKAEKRPFTAPLTQNTFTRLTLSCIPLCMFLSVAQMHDD